MALMACLQICARTAVTSHTYSQVIRLTITMRRPEWNLRSDASVIRIAGELTQHRHGRREYLLAVNAQDPPERKLLRRD
jgi:hypothetical protein